MRNKRGIALALLAALAVAVLLHVGVWHLSKTRNESAGEQLSLVPCASALDVETERACLGYSAAADQVVYEEAPELVKRYLSDGGEWVDLSRAADRCGAAASGRVPACWTTLTGGREVAPLGPAAAIVFLHERQTPAGARELVVVAYDGKMRLPWPTPGGWTISSIALSASVKSPEVQGAPLTRWHGTARRLDAEPFVAMYSLRLYAGQPDALDPTHFTIRYDLDGRPGTIDGWVLDPAVPAASQPAGSGQDEPPVVRFAVRDGQAKLSREQIWSPEEILRDHREQGLREGKRSWGLWPGDEPASLPAIGPI